MQWFDTGPDRTGRLLGLSSLLWVAALAYVGLSAAQAFHQSAIIPSVELTPLTFADQSTDFTLCVRHPKRLTRDDETQRALLSLELLPNSTDACRSSDLAASQTPAATVQPSAAAAQFSNVEPQAFILQPSPELVFLTQEGIAYTPHITLTGGVETSVVVANSVLAGANEGQIEVVHLPDSETKELSINLERWWGAVRRKLLSILLAPATGTLLALVAIVVRQFQKREEQEKEEKKEKEKREVEIKVKNFEAFKERLNSSSRDSFEDAQEWLEFSKKTFERGNPPLEVRSEIEEIHKKRFEVLFESFKDRYSWNENVIRRYFELLTHFQNVPYIQLDDANVNQIRDLQNLLRAARGKAIGIEVHIASEPMLLGGITELLWDQSFRQNEVERWLETAYKSNDADNFSKMILTGAAKVDAAQSTGQTAYSFLDELGREFVEQQNSAYVASEQGGTEQKSTTIKSEWKQALLNFIKDGEPSTPVLKKWTDSRRKEREQNEERRKSGLPFVPRELWPLKTIESSRTQNDANYDFPKISARGEAGEKPLYQLADGTEADAFKVCDEYLTLPNHHLMYGSQGAGKSWLRLYFDYYVLDAQTQVGDAVVTFYFPPASLLYRANEFHITKSLSHSIAHFFFVTTLLSRDSWQMDCSVLAPLFAQYEYQLPFESNSLVDPSPPLEQLNLETFFKQSYQRPKYEEMKQIVDAVKHDFSRPPTSTDNILREVKVAREYLGYKQLFVLVDNLDHLTPESRSALLTQLLKPNLLDQLAACGIYLKVFVTDIPQEVQSHFEKCATIEREAAGDATTQGAGEGEESASERYTLELYAYPNHEYRALGLLHEDAPSRK